MILPSCPICWGCPHACNQGLLTRPPALTSQPNYLRPERCSYFLGRTDWFDHWGRFSSLSLAVFCPLSLESFSSSPLSLSRKELFPHVPDKCWGFLFQSCSFLSLLNKVQHGEWSLAASMLSEVCLLPAESHTPLHGFHLHIGDILFGATLMHWLTLHMYHFRVSGASGCHNALSSESLYLHVSLNIPCWHSVISLLSCHNMCWKYLYTHISD